MQIWNGSSELVERIVNRLNCYHGVAELDGSTQLVVRDIQVLVEKSLERVWNGSCELVVGQRDVVHELDV